MYGFPSSRCYPRTISGANGAFPGTPEYAAALDLSHPAPSALRRIVTALVLVAICALLGAIGAEVRL